MVASNERKIELSRLCVKGMVAGKKIREKQSKSTNIDPGSLNQVTQDHEC